MIMRNAVFAFSADPVTNGHIDIVRRASSLFDDIVIATTYETGKSGAMFTHEERLDMCKLAFADIPCVFDYVYIESTAVELCKTLNAKFLIRGIRGYTDLDYEYKLAYLNRKISDGFVETIFIPGDPKLSMFSSTTVRELIKLGVKTWEDMVPPDVATFIKTRGEK